MGEVTKTKWQMAEELVKKHDQGSSMFVKLVNDADKMLLVFLGDPCPRAVCFIEGKYTPIDSKLKEQGVKPSFKIGLNVAVYESRDVKVLEMSMNLFKDVVRVKDKYGLDKWAFEVQRHGAAKDLKTTYSVLPDRQLTPEEIEEFQNLKLHDLEKLYAEETSAAGSLDTYDRKVEGPIDTGTAQAIMRQLKTMPREAGERFCSKFGISRVKDLPSGQLEKARAFVEVLATELTHPAPKEVPETDPFG